MPAHELANLYKAPAPVPIPSLFKSLIHCSTRLSNHYGLSSTIHNPYHALPRQPGSCFIQIKAKHKYSRNQYFYSFLTKEVDSKKNLFHFDPYRLFHAKLCKQNSTLISGLYFVFISFPRNTLLVGSHALLTVL